MLSETEFEKLICRPESSILDFKTKMYDFSQAKEKNTSALVKDVICFSNTIRKETSYIIIGIEEKEDGVKVLHGLDKNIDDSILQDKVKDKVFPRPKFAYYVFDYKGTQYGVLEFPIKKYSCPIYPVVKLKGLDVERIYYRNGTSNTEALGQEIIRINDWFKSLPDEIGESKPLSSKITNLLAQLTDGKIKLSVIFTETLQLARENDLKELVEFCTRELKGLDENEIGKSIKPEQLNYRIQKVFISTKNITINKQYTGSSYMLKEEMRESNDVFEDQILFNQPIKVIENEIERINLNPDLMLATIEKSSLEVFPNENGQDYPIMVYIFGDNFSSVYERIRQKAIDYLVAI